MMFGRIWNVAIYYLFNERSEHESLKQHEMMPCTKNLRIQDIDIYQTLNGWNKELL
jgi:hypothetical protein